MKKTLTYIACAILALSTVSCAKVGFSEPEPVGDGVTIQFLTTDLTKAGVDGIGNENKVNKIDWFVFPFKEDGSAVDSTATALLDGSIVPASGAQLDLRYSATLTSAQINTIFPTAGSRALVFAVANYTGTYPETITLNGLLALEVGNTFADGDRWPHPLATDDESLYFVMTGSAEIDLLAAQTKVELNRLASKVTVAFTYAEEIVDAHDSNLVWKPQNNGPEARVYLSNAIATATLGGPLTSRGYITDSKSTYADGTRDIFEYSYDYLTQLEGDPVYYTYPTKMEAGDDNQPYLKLVLPWYAYDKRDTSPNAAPVKQKEVYYKIALPLDALQESNRYYEYKVNVNIIGSDTEVEIAATYSVKNWFNKGTISSNVATGKYISLDIPKDEYDMYSDMVEILYVASGEVQIKKELIFQYNLSGSTVTEDQYMVNDTPTTNETLLNKKGIDADDINGWVSKESSPEGQTFLKISHKMDNNITTNGGKNDAFDMAPYVYRIRLHLLDAGDDTTFDRVVTITQYPSMYVTSTRSNGYVYVKGNTYSSNTANSNPASTYVYDDRGNNENYRIGSVANRSTALNTQGNNNGYNMIIHPTVMDPSLNLTIGDSRVATGSTLANINGLTKYKPSRDDVTNLVSPGFMIASSYGKTTTLISIELAEERCASYQENGYPAGRWRVPTEGEIQFLVKLSNYGFIPSLFDGKYWASSGRAFVSANNDFDDDYSNPTAVRCVYDTWYWGEEPVATGTAAQSWMGFMD